MEGTPRMALAALAMLVCAATTAAATSRIKDLASIEGIRQNQLIGYGLVVGLNGTGDTLNNAPFTKQSLQGMLERLGVNIRGQQLRTGNVAAVMVTANLPPFATQGTRIDVTASALGDAKSLSAELCWSRCSVPTAMSTRWRRARSPSADSRPKAKQRRSRAVFRRLDGCRTAPSSNARSNSRWPRSARCGSRCAMPISPPPSGSQSRSTIISARRSPSRSTLPPSSSRWPAKFPQNLVAMLTEIEQLQVEPDLAAKIIIDERSGVIVIGRDVRVSTVAVAQGNLTVTISETPQVSQPAPFSRGKTVTVPRTNVGVVEEGKKLALVHEGVSLQQIVDGLNALGIGPRDLISIPDRTRARSKPISR